MPELPEVEIVTRSLQTKLIGKQVNNCTVSFGKLIKNMEPSYFASNFVPFHFTSIHRKGKYIVFEDKVHKKWMTLHLGMTGSLFVVDNATQIPPRFQKHQHLFFELDSGEKMIYCDIRKFGDIRLFTEEPDKVYKPFIIMGPDPLNEPDNASFIEKARSKLFQEKEIKPSLLDSRLISGIGNIYACEVLFKTAIHPEELISSLSDFQLSEIYSVTQTIFENSITNGGSSVSDYVNSDGAKGDFQNFHLIYQKKVCSTCGTDVSKIEQNKRSTFYCPVCQPFLNKK